jgi:hypothetical protein
MFTKRNHDSVRKQVKTDIGMDEMDRIIVPKKTDKVR